MSRKNNYNVRPGVESLEARDVPSVSSLFFSGNILVVKTDNLTTSVQVDQVSTNYRITEVGSGRTWSYAASSVGKVEFQGGLGNDRFVNNVMNLPIRAFGGGGNDYLEGYHGADYFDGGDGNDIIKGYGGDDIMFGGNGDDVLLGGDGNDQLVGGAGNDRLNGQAGTDKLWGGDGNDVLIAIDNGTSDYVEGGAGRDIIWVDLNSGIADSIYGTETVDKVQRVAFFANGADKTLNGDRITDPMALSGQTYKTFWDRPLFSSAGPRASDIRQGALGDCWLLSGIGSIANDNAHAIRQNVVDFDDGTYGVRLGDKFYRVDNDLPASSSTATEPANAKFGAEGSMWAAVVEKAFAHYRTGANSYASLDGGWSVDVNKAFGTTSPGDKAFSSYSSATALANEIYSRWNNYEAVTVGFVDPRWAAGAVIPSTPLINYHMYMVISVARNTSGVVTSITLRNPWGRDGAGNDGNTSDGLVTVTPAQLFAITGRVNWGKV